MWNTISQGHGKVLYFISEGQVLADFYITSGMKTVDALFYMTLTQKPTYDNKYVAIYQHIN